MGKSLVTESLITEYLVTKSLVTESQVILSHVTESQVTESQVTESLPILKSEIQYGFEGYMIGILSLGFLSLEVQSPSHSAYHWSP